MLFGRPEAVGATVRACRDGGPDFVHLVIGYANHEVILHASGAGRDRGAGLHRARHVRWLPEVRPRHPQEDQLKAGLTPDDVEFGGGNLRPACCTCSTASTLSSTVRAGGLGAGSRAGTAAQDVVDVMAIIDLAARSEREGRRLPFASEPF